MRVLHLIPSLACGGAERQLVYLSAALADEGVETHVGFFWDGTNLAALASSGARCHRLYTRSNYDPRNTSRILALVRAVRPQVIQTWLTPMDVHVGLIAPFLRAPWIISERCSADFYSTGWKPQLRRLLAFRADAVISNSSGGLAYWTQHFGSDRRKHIPNIVPIEQIALAPSVPSYGPRPEPGQRLVLVVARLAPEKNVPMLLDALQLVLERFHDLTVQIIGDGDGALVELVEARLRKWHPRLRWLQHSDEVWSWLKLADVFVSVSLFEGSPNSALEAMQCGCALVLSDIEAHREMVSPQQAVFVPATQPALIAAGIERALACRPLRVADGTTDTSPHSAKLVARRHVALYQQLLTASHHASRDHTGTRDGSALAVEDEASTSQHLRSKRHSI